MARHRLSAASLHAPTNTVRASVSRGVAKRRSSVNLQFPALSLCACLVPPLPCLCLNHCQQLSRHHHVQRTFCSAIDFGLTNHRSWRSRPGSCLLCSTRQTCGPIRLPGRTTLATTTQTTSPCSNVFAHPPGQATLFSLPTVEPGTLHSHAPPAVSRLAHPLET